MQPGVGDNLEPEGTFPIRWPDCHLHGRPMKCGCKLRLERTLLEVALPHSEPHRFSYAGRCNC